MKTSEADYLKRWMAHERVRRARGPQQLKVAGVSLSVRATVFSPDPLYTWSTQIVLEEMRIVKGSRVLDVGTGSGILAIKAAFDGAAEVLGVDDNPVAIRCARRNAREAGVGGQVKFMDSCSILKKQSVKSIIDAGPYQTVLANLPIRKLEGSEISIHKTLIDSLPSLLESRGRAYITYASFGEDRSLIEGFCDDSPYLRDRVEVKKQGVSWYLWTLHQ